MLNTALLLLVSIPAAAAGPEPGVFVMGQARFTVLAPECIRIEYSTKSLFIDEPSRFATERGTRYLGYGVEQSTGRLVLDTGRIRLVYTPDGWPLSVANLKAEIRIGTGTVTWTPERNGEGRLDGFRAASPPLPTRSAIGSAFRPGLPEETGSNQGGRLQECRL